jgi:hypothetical protein
MFKQIVGLPPSFPEIFTEKDNEKKAARMKNADRAQRAIRRPRVHGQDATDPFSRPPSSYPTLAGGLR